LGLTASYGYVSQAVSDGTLSARSEVHVVPLTARIGYELWGQGRLGVVLGLGGALAIARYSTSLSADGVTAVAGGGLGFGALSVALGPGRAFFELSFTYL